MHGHFRGRPIWSLWMMNGERILMQFEQHTDWPLILPGRGLSSSAPRDCCAILMSELPLMPSQFVLLAVSGNEVQGPPRARARAQARAQAQAVSVAADWNQHSECSANLQQPHQFSGRPH